MLTILPDSKPHPQHTAFTQRFAKCWVFLQANEFNTFTPIYPITLNYIYISIGREGNRVIAGRGGRREVGKEITVIEGIRVKHL